MPVRVGDKVRANIEGIPLPPSWGLFINSLIPDKTNVPGTIMSLSDGHADVTILKGTDQERTIQVPLDRIR